jgi:hypothetical protein
MTRAGDTIHLRTQFKDDYGDEAQASNIVVHIYEPDADYWDLNAAYSVSGVPTYLGEGIYEYEFTAPSGPDGTWHDVWIGDLLYQTISGVMAFDVTNLGLVSSFENQLFTNDLVQITVASGLQATDGTFISEPFELEFLTTTSPSYSSPRKLRLEVGAFVENLPDMILEMAILEASLEADVLTFITGRYNDPLYKHARYEYVSCLASTTLLTNVGNLLLRSKTLADLSVTYDTNGVRDTMEKLKYCLDTWKPQLLAGGGAKAITQPSYVIKGELDPDRPAVSRSWSSTENGDISRRVPAANDRVQSRRSRRQQRIWTNPGKKLW